MELLGVEDNSGVRHAIRSMVASVPDVRECAGGSKSLPIYAVDRQTVAR